MISGLISMGMPVVLYGGHGNGSVPALSFWITLGVILAVEAGAIWLVCRHDRS